MTKYECIHGRICEINGNLMTVRNSGSKEAAHFYPTKPNVYSGICNLCLLELCISQGLVKEVREESCASFVPTYPKG